MAADSQPAAPAGPPGEVTALLARWREGDRAALDALVPLVYAELKRLAAALMRRHGRDTTLQPTAVVHELFVRLVERAAVRVADRQHFFALAARLLRQVLVDGARAGAAQKRGGAVANVTLEASDAAEAPAPLVDLLDLDRALAKLRRRDPAAERLVELRYFAGLTLAEAAAVLERSEASLSRDWAAARAFLLRELRPPERPGEVP